MNYQGKRVLVTGGAGFIGSHLAERLIRSGANVSVVDDLNSFYPSAWKRRNLAEIGGIGPYEFFSVDIRDVSSLELAFQRSQPEAVVHLAAYAGVRPSIQNPSLYEEVNIKGTINILELCRQFTVQKLIFGSSSSVYGASTVTPFSEDQVDLRPISPYAATKLAGELLAYTYSHLFHIPTICLRFFTVYGPRQRPDLAIRKFVALIESGLPVPIFGDGSMGRDYTWVDDIVSGVIAAIDYEPINDGNPPFEVFNLGNSHPVMLDELVTMLEEVCRKKAIRKFEPYQAGDVPLTWADITKASRLLNYSPSTPILKGLGSFVEWYRQKSPEVHISDDERALVTQQP